MSFPNPMSIFDLHGENPNVDKVTEKVFYCGNCGEKKHIYKNCPYPIISLGIILFKYNFIKEDIEFLLVRRKDTIGYVEFIRGRYAYVDYEYIQSLFNQMTKIELDRIMNSDFDTLWEQLWMEKKFKMKKRSFQNDYDQAKKKFIKIKDGYTVDKISVSLEQFVLNVSTAWYETEWGIPKGRRNGRESDIVAAKREFMEETGINRDDFVILSNYKTFVEEYIGSDNVRYRHIYYLAKFIGTNCNFKINKNNKDQVTEISKLQFFYYNDCLNVIRDYYKDKKSILGDAYKAIISEQLYKLNQLDFNRYNSTFNTKLSKSY